MEKPKKIILLAALAGAVATALTGVIIVTYIAGSSSFAASPTNGTLPMMVQFNDTSPGESSEWIWNFGDSSSLHGVKSSTAEYYNLTYTDQQGQTISSFTEDINKIKNPIHFYLKKGTYYPTLRTGIFSGLRTTSASIPVTVRDFNPIPLEYHKIR
jgi:PKD repeat protein